MKKITYLFGAGASRKALPIVEEIPNRIKQLISLLESDMFMLNDKETYDNLGIQNSKTKREHQLELIDSLKWMMNESANHASIDTFAKKLFIKGMYTELNKLKIVMSVFFIFEQVLNKPDDRYDSFFASLINNISDFPENVRILSWNYDSQFELAFSEYSDQKDISSNQRWLGLKSKYGDISDRNGKNKFGIYKLNGTTSLYSDGSFKQYHFATNLKTPVSIDFVDQITRVFVAATIKNLSSSLSFAWEEEFSESSIVNKAMEDTSDTVALVIIGYSFPFFNRQIDRQIIGNMTNLKKVYFQAPDADILKERFQAFRDDLSGIEMISKFDIGQFLLPNEL